MPTQYEPTLRELRSKYEAATRDAVRARLERDRIGARLEAAEEQLAAGPTADGEAAEEQARGGVRSAARAALLPR
jgi:hypothetical protein